jgi:hypothetical protein
LAIEFIFEILNISSELVEDENLLAFEIERVESTNAKLERFIIDLTDFIIVVEENFLNNFKWEIWIWIPGAGITCLR